MTSKTFAATEKTDAEQMQKLLQLLKKAQRLGLNFDVGNAYIRRDYIEQQAALNLEINALMKELTPPPKGDAWR
jgi:phage host-nuclease inhibitor protein Gam